MTASPKLQAWRIFAIQIPSILGVVTRDYCLVEANKSKKINSKDLYKLEHFQPPKDSKQKRMNEMKCADITEE